MLKIENLTSGYGPIVALKGVSLHVAPREVVTLIGANGSGKSTLLATMAGLIRPMSGAITFQGRNTARMSPEKLVRAGIALEQPTSTYSIGASDRLLQPKSCLS